MKVVCLKHCLEKLLTGSDPSRLSSLGIYGVVREDEKIANVLDIAHKHDFLPRIGSVATEIIEDEYSLKFIVSDGNVSILFKQQREWVTAELQIVALEGIYSRTPFPRQLMKKLEESCVLIFGCGSGGSRLAVGLARAGVGYLKLADPDSFEIENCSRHECDLTDIGRFKVNAVRERILRINPKIKVEVFPSDIFEDSKNEIKNSIFSKVDLVVGATDRASIQFAINAEAWNRNIPGVFSGCYEEARGGEVIFTIPEQTACLECIRGSVRQPEIRGQIDYSHAEGPEDYKGEPGLNAAIDFVTDVVEQFVLAMLLREEDCELAKLIDSKRNLILIGGALGSGYFVFKKPFHFIRPIIKGPRKDCSCQMKSSSRTDKSIDKDIEKMKDIPKELKEFL